MLLDKTRILVLSLFALALLAALPALASEPTTPAAAQAANPAAFCIVAPAGVDAAAPEAGALAWLDLGGANVSPVDASGSKKFHGFCPCGCSFIPDCNTSADCFGGATCQTAPSCC